MIWEVTKKELRECIALCSFAVLAAIAIVLTEIRAPLFPWSERGTLYAIPFVSDSFYEKYATLSGIIAVTFGLKQAASEYWQGTYGFVLHRTASRRRLFSVKITVGILQTMTLASIPILLYTAWAASPRATPTPFVWSMQYPEWTVFAVIPTVYLGAFLCGVRSSGWVARSVTLVGAAAIAALCARILESPWYPFGWVALVIANLILIITIFHVAENQDY